MPEKDRPQKADQVVSATTDDSADALGGASTGATAVPRKTAEAKTAPAKKSGTTKAVAEKTGTEKTVAGKTAEPAKKAAPAKVRRSEIGDRSWVPWVFVPVGLIGVAWLVVYYIVGDFMPGITGGWNILVGMGCMAAAFAIATLWK